jgi:hypothetical protein
MKMSEKYPIIPEYLEKAIADTSIDLIDVLSYYLKTEMHEMNESNLEEWESEYMQGYHEALVDVFALQYVLIFARQDVLNGK